MRAIKLLPEVQHSLNQHWKCAAELWENDDNNNNKILTTGPNNGN
jgi:hypothetical protein